MKIWIRYILCKFWISFFSLLLGTCLFYAAVHFSLHTIRNGTPINASWSTISLYYLSEIMLKNEIIAFQLTTISVIIVLSSMQSKREILLLRSSGLSLRKILTPLIISGAVLSCVLYCHFEWLSPKCEYIVSSTDLFLHKKYERVPSFYLKDQSLLICSSVNKQESTLHDVFWIKEFDNVYKMKRLRFSRKNSALAEIGEGVIEFKRDEEDRLYLKDLYNEKEFPEIEFTNSENPFSKFDNINSQSKLSEMFKAISWQGSYFGITSKISQRTADLTTQFYYKAFSPLICFASVILPAIFCLQFQRIRTYSYVYLISLFILNFIFLSFRALCVLAKYNIVPPLQACLTPILLLLILICLGLKKINRC